MDHIEPCNIEFLDLTGVDEEEKSRVLLSLRSSDPNVKLPWKYNEETRCAQQTHNAPESFFKQKNESRNVNCATAENQQYPTNVPPHHIPSAYPAYVNQKLNHSVYIVPNYQTPPVVFCDEFSRPLQNHLQKIPQTPPTLVTNYIVSNQANCPDLGSFNKVIKVEEDDSNVGDKNEEASPKRLMNGITDVKVNTETHQQTGAVNKNSLSPNTSAANQNEGTPNKSWASLFNKSTKSPLDDQIVENGFNSKPSSANSSHLKNVTDKINKDDAFSPIKEPHRSDFDDPNYYRMGEFLLAHTVDSRIISLQPRGLINRSNYCYINSILQALLACPPVYNLLCNLSQNVTTDKKKVTPIIDGMSRFVKQFNHLPAGMRVNRRQEKNQKKELNVNINCDTPFEPSWIYKILSGMRSDTFVIEGRQEDAEEFLGCLLNGLNDEMLELIKLVSNTNRTNNEDRQEQNDVDKEWQVMGPKNKGSVTRRTDFARTPISDIFGGLLRSRVHRTGDLSTDNIQPFFTLQLNIEKATTVQEALEFLVTKIQLEGVTSSKTNQEVEAWQQVTIEELPIVLVLHLKCFDYKLDGCTKIIKALEFPIDLKIDPKLLSSKTNSSAKEKQYKLFAVVYHDGKETSKGHYVTDAYHVGYASWLRYDDASVKAVQEEQVLKPQGTRVPYLLFYRRCDSIRSK